MPEPEPQHQWLARLVGEWSFEGQCAMGPEKPMETFTGEERVRSMGGLWTVGEGSGDVPGGGRATTIMTLGYDPRTKRFVGTFIASMMTHMWLYDGELDGDTLTLNTEGPSMTEEAGLVAYRDVIEFKSDDHRVLTSWMPGENGEWVSFMTAQYRRK